MSNETLRNARMPRDLYETIKVQLYMELENLIDDCEVGHGDKHLLWSIRKARHELLKSLSDSAGVEYPELLEWLTDQDRIIHVPNRLTP